MTKFKLYLLTLLLTLFNACKNEHTSHETHDEHKQHNMSKNAQNGALLLLLKPTNEFVISQVKTVTLQEKELPIDFQAIGNITYDTRLVNTISAKVSGRIEKLYIKYKYQPIRKGEKLMDIYSKELITEQENYLFLLKNDTENTVMINAVENKLILIGLTKEQIEELKTRKKVFQTVTIYSPYNGHLHDVSASTSNNNMDNSKPMTRELSIKEGMYIEKGQAVFNVYSTDKVWALLNIYPEGQSMLKAGQKVKLYIDGAGKDQVEAKVDFIEPLLHENQKTISVRVYLNNTAGDIKIGANVKATIVGENKKGNYIPSTALLSLGINNIVFIKHDKLFKATPVKTGIRTGDWTEIISGINQNDSLAENAQLLMDSEGFIKTDTQ